MCGRFTLHTPESRLREVFKLDQSESLGLVPRYNIAPSQLVPMIRDTDAGREMVMTTWGLVPHWSKESNTRYSTINAWKVIDGRKVPHHIRMRDGGVFALAGRWDRREGDGESLDSCSIIVMPANNVMKTLHERMPAIIAPANYDLWLDRSVSDKNEIMGYLDSSPSSRLVTYPVSSRVNSPMHDDKHCIEPAANLSD